MKDDDVVAVARRHLRQLSPHVKMRDSALMLERCVVEIERLRARLNLKCPGCGTKPLPCDTVIWCDECSECAAAYMDTDPLG